MADTSNQRQLHSTGDRITPEPPRLYVSINEVQRMVGAHRVGGLFWGLGFIGVANVLWGLFTKKVSISYTWVVLSLFILLAVIYECVFLHRRKKHLEEHSVSFQEFFDKNLESYATATSTPGRELLSGIGIVSGVEYRRKRGSNTWHWCKNCSNWPRRNYDTRFTKPTDGKLDNQCRAKEKARNCQY